MTESNPEDGATLKAAPSELEFTFSEPIGQSAVALTAPDGSQVDLGEPEASDRTVVASVPELADRGTYAASYRVVSADGHPIEGTVEFELTVGAEPQAAESGPAESDAQATSSETDEDSFFTRHRTHIFWGILAIAVAALLLFEPWRRRDETHDA